MKEKLQCDNCGGNLIHQINDLFVCEHCGTGYRVGEPPAPKPRNDNIIRINEINPDRISQVSSEFANFTGSYTTYLEVK